MQTVFRIGEWRVSLAEDSHPQEAMIEITTRCNQSCVYCFRNAAEDLQQIDMDPKLFEKIVEDLCGAGVKRIVFSGWGEPTVHPRITDLIAAAKNRDLEVVVNTNGFLLDILAEEFFKLGVDEIVVSVDAFDIEHYLKFRPGGSYVSIIKGLTILKELRMRYHSYKPKIRIQFTMTKNNVHELEKAIDFAKTYAISEIIVSNIIPLNRYIEEELACYNDMECVSIAETMKTVLGKELFSAYVQLSMPSMKPRVERRCPFVERSALFIRVDGLVTPCIFYAHSWKNHLFGVDREVKEVVFGDLKHENLLDIWRKPCYAMFRFRAKFFHMPSCLDCDLRLYCEPTQSNEKDCWGNAPTCAFCPYSHDMVRCPL